MEPGPTSEIAAIVRAGLASRPKRLPPSLFYDRRGSELFEQITALPEYYLTRTERQILEVRGAAMVDAVLQRAGGAVTVLELGAGTATKTEVLLRAVVRAQGPTRYVPADVSPSALAVAAERLTHAVAGLDVRAHVGTHATALHAARGLAGAVLVLFLGSSIGNYDEAEAAGILRGVRSVVGARGALLLGADRRKPRGDLLAAYDDAAGVTAAFNRNVLERINRELGGHFDPASFRHVASWNEETSAVEMHLESTRAQRVRIDALGYDVSFDEGERIHTESSRKYDEQSLADLLGRAGLVPLAVFGDPLDRYSLSLAGAHA
jgi:dimethylhistidine N-methyltransferase